METTDVVESRHSSEAKLQNIWKSSDYVARNFVLCELQVHCLAPLTSTALVPAKLERGTLSGTLAIANNNTFSVHF